VAAGWLVSTLTGAGLGAVAGAAIGGLAGALVEMGVPEEEAGYYAEGVRRGGTLVTVRADDDRAERIANMLDQEGAVNIRQRSEYYRSTGYAGYQPNTQPYSTEEIARERTAYQTYAQGATGAAAGMQNRDTRDINAGREVAIPVVEEDIQIGKRQVQRGGARIHTHVTERPVQEQVNLREEHVHVERHPVDRPVAQADMAAFREGTIEVTETAEVPVVAKEARVVEEVIIGKETTQRTETVQDTVRRTEVDVEPLTGRMAGDFNAYANDFRSHWQGNFANQGGRYEDYEPAYRYGYEMAGNSRYQGRDWTTFENDIQRDWNTRYPNTWDRMRNSIRYGWERATGDRTPGIQTGGRNADGSPDTRGITEKAADAITGDRIDDKTGKRV
jgi:uncharacterized protein (TIGR02271 family)